MTEKAEYIVRKAKREDMVGVLKLCEEHGWNKLLEHLQHQFDLFPDGVFIAENAAGEIISHCSSVLLDDDNGFMALYITKSSWRGKGIGRKVFDMSYKALGNRNVGLNSAEDCQSMYTSSGFRISTVWLQPYQCPIKHLKINFNDRRTQDKGMELIPVGEIGMNAILAYDMKIHTIQRENILHWYLDFACTGLAAVDEDGKLVGWGLLCRGYTAYCIMPLYADTQHIAKTLLSGLLQNVQEEKDAIVQVIFPIENTGTRAMFDEMGFSAGQSQLRRRMFTLYDVPFETNHVFSVLNLDTGIV